MVIYISQLVGNPEILPLMITRQIFVNDDIDSQLTGNPEMLPLMIVLKNNC